ncbi:MAG: manganese efflux pump MntP family protein [Planctomycetaceae bacterium]|nr:manganese efflux pump MntP family protein [Planctomycetaceae bacterium]
MQIWAILMVAAGLGMDAMSVSMAIGVRWHGRRQIFRLAWHMGLFQFLMPLAGSFAGRELAGLLKDVGAYIAAVLVIALGVKMLYEALKSHPGAAAEKTEHAIEHGRIAKDPTRGWSLIALSLATSVDALVVGISMGLKQVSDVVWPSVVIGLVAGAMSMSGTLIGRRLGKAIGRYAEIAGASALIILGAIFPWI